MKLAVILPRNTCFSPYGATSIDLCAYDYVSNSRFRNETMVFCPPTDRAFNDVKTIQRRRRAFPLSVFSPSGYEAALKKFQPDALLIEQTIAKGAPLSRRFDKTFNVLRRHNFISLKGGKAAVAREAKRLEAFDHVVAVSQVVRNDVLENSNLTADQVSVVHNGIDVNAWRPARVRSKTVAFAGRLSPEKNVLELVEAWQTISRSEPQWRLQLMLASPDAYPDYRDKVVAAIGKIDPACVSIHYDAMHDDVRASFENASIVVSPSSRWESFGLTAIEAFAGGAVFVGPNIAGLGEVMGGAGLPLEDVTVGSIARAIVSLILDETLRNRLSAMGSSRVREHFDIKITAGQLDDVVEQSKK